MIGLRNHDIELRWLCAAIALERTAFFIVKGLMVLFLTAPIERYGLAWSNAAALSLMGTVIAAAYGTTLIGGWIGDRVQRRGRITILGGALIALGQLLLATVAWLRSADLLLWTAILCIALGAGLFKANITHAVGQVYNYQDTRRHAAFTLFWTCINIGSALAFIIGGTVGQLFGWMQCFILAALMVVIGTACFSFTRAARQVTEPTSEVVAASAPTVDPLAGEAWGSRLTALACTVLLVAFFSVGFNQFFGSVNLFAEQVVDRTVFGITLPTGLLLALEPIFIVILAPFAARLWSHLAEQERNPAANYKFAAGFALLAMGFAVIAWIAAGTATHTLLLFLLAILLLSLSEIPVQPIGLETAVRLAPSRSAGFIVGVYFLALAGASWGAGELASFFSRGPATRGFQFFVLWCIAALILCLLLPKKLVRLLQRA
jgi:proton-dependent oligopeptide transporter, POT family